MNDEDVKKMLELINQTKQEVVDEFQYEEFINYDGSDFDENEEPEDIDEDYLLSDLANADISQLSTYDTISSLKPEERLVTDSCSDPELKNLLLLNRTKSMQLIQLYKKLKDMLIECQKNIADKTDVIKQYKKANKGQSNSTGAWRLGAPYFKDKKLFGTSPNADVARKQKNQELTIYDLFVAPKWSGFECEKVIRAVKLNYNINQQNSIVKKIKELTTGSGSNRQDTVKELEARLKELKGNDNSEAPPLNSDEHIDWTRVAEVFLKDKHSAFECRSFWHLYLHPKINKSPWTPEENKKLKEIVDKHKEQNWDRIAKDVGNNRTGFTACINYQSNLHNKCKKGEFTNEEDMRLIELVDRYKMGHYIPWVKIVQHFKNRTRTQLHYRWTYYLTQNDKRKGKFTEAEDVLLMIIVDKYGRNFKKCAEFLPTRSMVQCKARYNTNLSNSIKKGSFSLKEDQIIVDFVDKHGTKAWTDLTEQLRRSRGQIRQRYNTIKIFLDTYPDATLSHVPRRKHNMKKEERTHDFLRLVADKYKDKGTIPTLAEIERVLGRNMAEASLEVDQGLEEDEEFSLRISGDTPAYASHIDNLLTDFFCNSFKLSSSKCTSAPFIEKAVDEVQALLDLLKVKLDIPDNFDQDVHLDNLDVAILANLLERRALKYYMNTLIPQEDVCQLVPPNLNTVIGLRSLLIKYSQHRTKKKQDITNIFEGLKKDSDSSKILWDVCKHAMNLPSEERLQIENDRRLFYKRFYSLLKWPAIMTLQEPSLTFQINVQVAHFTEPMPVRRTYGKKPAPIQPAVNIKRMKITELPSTSTSKATPIKLTQVTDKSVIENLMRDKNKKLFCFDKIQQGDTTKMILREIKLPHIVSKENIEAKAKQARATVNILQCGSPQSATFHRRDSESSVAETIDDADSIFSESLESVEDTGNVKKIKVFVKNEYSEDGCLGEENDLADVNKLNMFLKQEQEANSDSDESNASYL